MKRQRKRAGSARESHSLMVTAYVTLQRSSLVYFIVNITTTRLGQIWILFLVTELFGNDELK